MHIPMLYLVFDFSLITKTLNLCKQRFQSEPMVDCNAVPVVLDSAVPLLPAVSFPRIAETISC